MGRGGSDLDVLLAPASAREVWRVGESLGGEQRATELLWSQFQMGRPLTLPQARLRSESHTAEKLSLQLARRAALAHSCEREDQMREILLGLSLCERSEQTVVEHHSDELSILHRWDGARALCGAGEGLRTAIYGEWERRPERQCGECARRDSRPSLERPAPVISRAYSSKIERALAGQIHPHITHALLNDGRWPAGLEREERQLLDPPDPAQEIEPMSDLWLNAVRAGVEHWFLRSPDRVGRYLLGEKEHSARVRQVRRELPDRDAPRTVAWSVRCELDRSLTVRARALNRQKLPTLSVFPSSELPLTAERVRELFLRDVCTRINRLGGTRRREAQLQRAAELERAAAAE